MQLRGQEIDLLRKHRRNHPTAPIPLVLLVALYHGAKAYRGPRTVGESMGLPPEWVPERWKHEDLILIDLAELDVEKLTQDKLGLFLRVLKHIYDPQVAQESQNLESKRTIHQSQGTQPRRSMPSGQKSKVGPGKPTPNPLC